MINPLSNFGTEKYEIVLFSGENHRKTGEIMRILIFLLLHFGFFSFLDDKSMVKFWSHDYHNFAVNFNLVLLFLLSELVEPVLIYL